MAAFENRLFLRPSSGSFNRKQHYSNGHFGVADHDAGAPKSGSHRCIIGHGEAVHLCNSSFRSPRHGQREARFSKDHA
jgi:hypothetical protein